VAVVVSVLVGVSVRVVALDRVDVVYTVDVSVFVTQEQGHVARLWLSAQSRYWQKSGSVSQMSCAVVVAAMAAAISEAQEQGQTSCVEPWLQSTTP
jgi:hypothetical protein